MTPDMTVPRWWLARTLRAYRTESGLRSVAVARKLGWDPSKLSRIESSQQRVTLGDAYALLTTYEIPPGEKYDDVVALVELARTEGWWDSEEYKGVFRGPLAGLEAGASTILIHELVCIPGLFQTPEYAQAVIAASGVLDEAAIRARVAARMTRQEALQGKHPPKIRAVIDEAAILRPVGGPEVMADQVTRLIRLAELPHISVRIIPLDVGAYPLMTVPFQVMGYDGLPSLVYVDVPGDPVVMEKSDHLIQYREVHAQLVEVSLSEADSLGKMTETFRRLSDRGGD